MTEGTAGLRLLIPLIVFCVSVSVAGCRSYAPRPLDLEAHAADWRDRRADDSTVLAFVQSLRAAESDAIDAVHAQEGTMFPAAFDPAAGIELRDAEWVALVYNPDLRLARADREVMRAIAQHAGLWDDPAITLDVLRILAGVANPWTIGSAISVTLPLSGRLEREKILAAAEHEVALLRVLEHERETIRQLRRAWLTWSILHHRIALIDDLLADLETIAATAGRLAEAGEMLRTEASLFEIEQTSRDIEREVLRERGAAAEEEIRSIMGLSPDAPLRPIARVAFAAANAEFTIDVPGDMERANAELARLRAAYAAAEDRLHLEVRKQYPDVTLGPQHEYEDGQSRIGFIAGVPLPILNANRQAIAEAEQNRDRARAEFETAYERLVGRMSVLRRLVSAARLEQRQIESRLAPLIDRQVADARRLLDIGEGSPLALLDGVVRRHQAKLRAMEAIATEGEATIELLRLRGDHGR